jgi:signal transduction histidine kinase
LRIGTRGGLGRWQDGAFSALTRAQGLPDEVISQILEDDRDHLWFGSNQGIFRVARAELERAAREPAFQVNPLIFGLADGMASLECTGGFHPSGLKTGDGRLWFSTVKGLVMVDPARLHVNEIPPPVRVEEILVDGSPVNPAGHSKSNIGRGESGSIAIGPGARRVEIHYTALSLAVPERNRFKHRLEGLEPRWVEAGPQRVATYPRLAPGRYRFHVVACNNDGIWNETGATLALTVLPAFWQTWWFRAAVLVLLLTAGSWAVRHASQRRLRRKLSVLEHQHGLERERARIARDIHDELGASLTRITLLTELGLKNRERPEQWTATLGKISATARESVRAMDAIVWAVNPRNDSLDHFANYLSQFAEELFRLTPIRCRIDMPTVLPEHALTTETRHQLLLAVKEALNNVIRHSRADEVWLRLRVDDGQLELAIEDDGCGLPTEDPGDGHDGLTNIRSRVEGLAGRCEMQSQPGHGTVLRMIVPLPRPIAP